MIGRIGAIHGNKRVCKLQELNISHNIAGRPMVLTALERFNAAPITKLSTIPHHQLSITCGFCKHHTLLEVANLIAVVEGDKTAHEVRQRARCHNCGVKSNNTYQIVYTCNSDVAMVGAGVGSD